MDKSAFLIVCAIGFIIGVTVACSDKTNTCPRPYLVQNDKIQAKCSNWGYHSAGIYGTDCLSVLDGSPATVLVLNYGSVSEGVCP